MCEEDVQQLAEVIAEELDGTSVDGSKRWDQPTEDDVRVARAVLRSGRVVAASDVRDLAQRCDREDRADTEPPSWWEIADKLWPLIDPDPR